MVSGVKSLNQADIGRLKLLNSKYKGYELKWQIQSIKEIVNQVTVPAATAVMMAFRDTDTGPQLATTPHQWKNQRQRNGGLVLEMPRFNWDVPDRYV